MIDLRTRGAVGGLILSGLRLIQMVKDAKGTKSVWQNVDAGVPHLERTAGVHPAYLIVCNSDG
jgi:hypothetical protein